MQFLPVPFVAALALLQDGAKPPPAHVGGNKDAPAPAEAVAAARRIAAQQPAEHPLPARTVDVLHYVVRVAVDLRAHKVEGSGELTLHVAGGARRTIELDADELIVKGVVDGNQQPLTHTQKGTTLSIDLGRDVPPEEELRLRVDYSATPRRGLVFVDGPPASCWSQGECQMNSAWFPCRDFPDDRASSELYVTVADGLRTISNGVLIETLPADVGRHTDHWRMDFPHPAYLTSLVVGPFVEIDLGRVRDLPLLAYATADRKDAVAAALQPTGRMVELLEGLAGVQYPYPAYRQIAVADFPYGGMENVGATTLSQEDLPPADRLAEGRDDVDALVVHELAHQWFGDLVNANSWADIWLSEGFATFAEPWWIEKTQGTDAAVSAWLARREKAVKHRLETPRPVVSSTYFEPDDVFDPTIYENAGCFLELLRRTVGEEKFLAATRAWIAREQGKAATTADFESVFAEVAGAELSVLFREWLHGAGVPQIEFRWSFDEAQKSLELTAEQKQAGPGVPEVFHVPVDVAYVVGGARRTTRFALDGRKSRASVPCDAAPAWVRFNDGGGLFGALHVEQPPAAWCDQLAGDADPYGRVEAADALAETWTALAADDALRKRTLAALARSLVEDKVVAVRAAAATALGAPGKAAVGAQPGTPAAASGEVARTALCAALWDEVADVRSAAAEALGEFAGDDLATGALLRRFESEARLDVRAACIEAVAAGGAGDVGSALLKLVDSDRFPALLRGAALTGLASMEKLDDDVRGRVVERATRLTSAGQTSELRKAAVKALGTLAKRSDAAAFALVGLLDDPSLAVKSATLDALEEAESLRTLAGLVRFYETAAFPDQRSHARRILAALLASLPP
ncbi:MAG TPA: M1 family aminopeptidase [Planctomycetota bacterium]|nr:M1 family aminopeptidase [Planctomycetota bacterium]